MFIERNLAALYGQETVQMLKVGFYVSVAGRRIEIAAFVNRAVEGTRSYPANQPINLIQPKYEQTDIEVRNESTLESASRLIKAGYRPVALNFASATHPGGGFLNGARAQEESLARSSGLYACLVSNEMYAFHKRQHDPMYSDYAIYSPDIPVFRADDGTLLDEPFLCSFITCAAVNAKEVMRSDPFRYSEIREIMRGRILKVLAIGAKQGHDAIILGAWGCGAFGNDANEFAELFGQALRGNCRGLYKAVTFAVLDFSDNNRFIGPFRNVFESA